MFVLIGRLKRATPEGALTKGVWHAAYVGERQLFRHHWGTGAASTSRSVTGAQPKCGANMMTGGKGLHQITYGEPKCRRCRRVLGLPNEPISDERRLGISRA